MPLGLAAGWLPYRLGAVQGAAAASRKFEEQFPEAIELIARALRAGHAFTTGLALVAEELPDPVGGEFRLVYDRQNFGMPVADALHLFAERVPLLDARFFVTAVLTQRESGGNLAEILDNLGVVIRQRFRVRRQIRVVTAHARLTGWVLVAMPLATALAMLVVAPDHILTLVTDPLGIQMLVAAVGAVGHRLPHHPRAHRRGVLTRALRSARDARRRLRHDGAARRDRSRRSCCSRLDADAAPPRADHVAARTESDRGSRSST